MKKQWYVKTLFSYDNTVDTLSLDIYDDLSSATLWIMDNKKSDTCKCIDLHLDELIALRKSIDQAIKHIKKVNKIC